jgi:hypothetical protein
MEIPPTTSFKKCAQDSGRYPDVIRRWRWRLFPPDLVGLMGSQVARGIGWIAPFGVWRFSSQHNTKPKIRFHNSLFYLVIIILHNFVIYGILMQGPLRPL